MRKRELQAFLAVTAGRDLISMPGKVIADASLNMRIVLDHQNRSRRGARGIFFSFRQRSG